MLWGAQPWIKELLFANAASQYEFKHGESGKLTFEFFVAPFDYAPPEPFRAIESTLTEDKVIGMSWAILDYDDESAEHYRGFRNLSHKTTMYGNASDLVAFCLMPVEKALRKPIEAAWSFHVVSPRQRRVAFHDESLGNIEFWNWDFGDGKRSNDQHPIHRYEKAREYIVTLDVEGPEGKARRTKVWDVTLP